MFENMLENVSKIVKKNVNNFFSSEFKKIGYVSDDFNFFFLDKKVEKMLENCLKKCLNIYFFQLFFSTGGFA